jgi:hypothetical protein
LLLAFDTSERILRSFMLLANQVTIEQTDEKRVKTLRECHSR